MPRLPTIRVIGSQFFSTILLGCLPAVGIASAMSLSSLVRPRRPIAGVEARARAPPFGLLVEVPLGDPAPGADRLSAQFDGAGRQHRPGRRVHERHELVW